MPVSQGSAGGIPGLNLKAWAFMDASGNVLKSFNVASNVRTGGGAFTLTFTAAMSSIFYLVRVTQYGSGTAAVVGVTRGTTTAGATAYTTRDTAGAASDGIHLVEVYE